MSYYRKTLTITRTFFNQNIYIKVGVRVIHGSNIL